MRSVLLLVLFVFNTALLAECLFTCFLRKFESLEKSLFVIYFTGLS